MKIGYVICRFPAPSETFVSREIESLIAAGVELEVYAFEAPGAADAALLSPIAAKLRARTQYISKAEAAAALANLCLLRVLPDSVRLARDSTAKAHPLLRLGRAAALARRIKKNGVAALHAHWPYATQVAHLASILSGLPYSASIHAHEVEHDNGHFPTVFRRISFAAFCNRGAMNHLLRQLAIEAGNRAHLVYHGVDLTAFTSLPWPRETQPLQIISAGRLTRTKGFDRLILACNAACRRGLDVHLTILGAGALQQSLQRLAESLEFADRLHMPGWVPHDEVRRYMERAHLFALLADTGFHDGLPNVALEAMACGRPVILSPLPAAREAVSSGVEGFVLRSADDIDGFVAALELCIRRPGLLEQMGAAARRRVESEHDAQAQIVRMTDLFRRYAA